MFCEVHLSRARPHIDSDVSIELKIWKVPSEIFFKQLSFKCSGVSKC